MADVSLGLADPSGTMDSLMSPLLTPSRQPPLALSLVESPSLSGSFVQSESVDEMRALKARIKAQQNELESERETVTTMRKKLNSVERDRLDAVSRANEEVSRLDSEVTRLQAQLERGEANRQSLEYDLAKARKEIVDSRRATSEREHLMQGLNDGTKRKLDEVSAQVNRLNEELELHKSRSKDEAKRLRDTLHNKDEELFSCRSERDTLERENQKFAISNEDKDKLIGELEDQLKNFQGGQREQSESLRRQIHENEFLREKEERMRKDFEAAQQRVHVLEESVEAERAAHLESKFNSEIVQLRIRDLEAALELEKNHKSESSAVSDNLSKQIRELQHIYEEERQGKQEAQANLRSVEKELSSVNLQLRGEVSEKSSLIKQLSSQLDTHQENFNELKQELSKAKKRQVYLEETYTGSIKELEILLDNFEPVSSDQQPSKRKSNATIKTSTKKLGGSKTQTLSSLLESLRRILIDYKRKLDDKTADFARLKSQTENSSKEIDQYKDMLWHKDKALETAQQGLTRTSKELRHYQTEARELEIKVGNLTKELNLVKSNLDKNCKENEGLREQVFRVAAKCKTGEKSSGEFLHALYCQMTASLSPSSPSLPIVPPTQDAASIQTWEDLARLVSQQASQVTSQLQRCREKVLHYETLVSSKDCTIKELQAAHEEQLNKLSTITDGRSQHWAEQRAEMEAHYTQLLSELHSRHKKTQSLADQAWDKVRANASVQQSLEEQCGHLQSALTKQQSQGRALRTACGLLFGVLAPLASRTWAMVSSKQQQSEDIARLAEMKLQVSLLAEALRWDANLTPKPSPDALPILRFRAAVVAVIAANRLSHFGRNSGSFTTIRDPLAGIPSLDFHIGNPSLDEEKFVGLHHPKHQLIKGISQQQVVAWLTTDDLMTSVSESLSELTSLLNSDAQQNCSQIQLTNAIQTSTQRLLSQMEASFMHLMTPQKPSHSARQHSLCGRLAQGLLCLLARLQQDGKHCYLSSQSLAGTLQDQVLSFTHRLHAAEVERRDLRLEVSRLQEAQNSLAQTADLAAHLQAEVVDLQGQVEHGVEKSRFEAVCAELKNALHREQEAQRLLKEQAAQLHQLTLQMDAERDEGSQKERTLTDAVHDLNEAKAEARRQEQRARQLSRQLETTEEDKRQLQGNVADAEAALRTAARDRDNLTCYLRNIHRFLESAKTHIALQMNTSSNIERMLSPDLLPPQASSKPSAELTACRGLVSAFVDLQKQLEGRVEALQATVQSQQQKAMQMKHHDTFPPRNVGPQQIDDLAIAEMDRVNVLTDKVSDFDTAFEPLMLEDNSLIKPSSQSKSASLQTPSASRTRSSLYQTPKASTVRNLKTKSQKGKQR